MKPRLLADEIVSHDLVRACLRLDSRFPIAHIAAWRDGACLQLKDPALPVALTPHRITLEAR